MSAEYFSHEYTSNSDLKKLVNQIINGEVMPENIDVIYDQGTLNHQALLEPYKADVWLSNKLYGPDDEDIEAKKKAKEDYELACIMAKTVLKDDLCRKFIMMQDFRREHEFYRLNVYGIKGRCKTDGDSKILQTCFEYKGLALTTEKAFDDALYHFDYDHGATWYLDVMKYKYWLVAAVSKEQPDRLFKRLVDRNHLIYLRGREKVIKSTNYWKMYFN